MQFEYINQRGSGLLIFGILVLVISCKEPRKRIVDKFSDGNVAREYYYPDKTDTSSFISIQYYPDGKVHRRDTVQNRKIVGKPTIYYPNGQIYEIDSLTNSPDVYTNGWDGIETHFYNNGRISEQFMVKNGIVNGLSKHYNINGLLIKEYYLKDTIKNGEYKDFYKNGNVLFKTTFLNGLPTGFEYFFGENGDTIKYYAVNEKGELTLPYKRWLNNGTILKGDFVDTTEKAALWIWFSKDGKELEKN